MPVAHSAPPYLLVLRFALFNLAAIAVLGAVVLGGWLDGAFEGYTRWLSLGIFAVFLYGMALCAMKVWRVSRELEAVRAGAPAAGSTAGRYVATVDGRSPEARSMDANLLHLHLTHYIAVVRQIGGSLVFLGLIGTVIGFIVALSGVDPQRSATIDTVAPMVATLITGMSIALYTTLIGAVLHVWLMVNHRILATGAIALFNATVELGERRVGV